MITERKPGQPRQSLGEKGKRHFSRRVIHCSWCGKVVVSKAPRMRLFESESIYVSGNWLAHFHPECGDALLDLCETNAAMLRAAADNDLPF